MNSDNLISVIVPIFNSEKYLDECINSIVCQTYANIEILLVDDGSEDSSKIICKKWEDRDERVRLITQKNGGVAKARNTGIENSKGALLLMVDSDDYIAPNMIESLYNGYLCTEADIVICDYEQGIDREYSFSVNDSDFRVFDFETIMKRVYADGHDALRFISPWGKLYNADLFASIRYPEGKIFEDIYVTHQLLQKARKVAVVDQKYVYYYRHDDSIMHRPFHLGKLDYLDALKERIGFFQSNGYSQLEKDAYEEYLHSLIWEYSRVRDILHDKEAKKEICNRFREVYKEGYGSERYPQETATFLKTFNTNPELIVWYWKINSRLKRIAGEKK